ncbi:MAG: hypothetical protein IPO83_01795 [Chitinophagaceae bacterium]|nr:hypothetical protein [Chitinophagaceae bacterium]
MIDPTGKITLAKEAGNFLYQIYNSIKVNRPAIAEAVTAIQKAVIKTRNFISDQGYVRNEELTELWHIALNKVVAAGIKEKLPTYLYHKAKFWGTPEDWLNHPPTLELVPQLDQLDEICNMLLLKIS